MLLFFPHSLIPNRPEAVPKGEGNMVSLSLWDACEPEVHKIADGGLKLRERRTGTPACPDKQEWIIDSQAFVIHNFPHPTPSEPPSPQRKEESLCFKGYPPPRWRRRARSARGRGNHPLRPFLQKGHLPGQGGGNRVMAYCLTK